MWKAKCWVYIIFYTYICTNVLIRTFNINTVVFNNWSNVIVTSINKLHNSINENSTPRLIFVHSTAIIHSILFASVYSFNPFLFIHQLIKFIHQQITRSTHSRHTSTPLTNSLKFSGSANSAGMIIAPLSTLLITIDRIYTILAPLHNNNNKSRFRVQMLSVALLIVAFCVVTLVGFLRTYDGSVKTTSELWIAGRFIKFRMSNVWMFTVEHVD